MDGRMQLKLAMFGRLQNFLQTYPPGDEPATQVVARFTEGLRRLRALVVEQQQGEGEREAQHAKQRELRERMSGGPLRHLSRIGRSLDSEQAEVTVALVRRTQVMSHERFRATVRNVVATIEREHDLLRANGMAERTLDELNGLIAEYEQAARDANAGLLVHTGARGEMQALSRELMQVVRQLDGIVVYHAGKDAKILSAWRSARNVAWPAAEVVVAKVSPPAQLLLTKQGDPKQ